MRVDRGWELVEILMLQVCLNIKGVGKDIHLENSKSFVSGNTPDSNLLDKSCAGFNLLIKLWEPSPRLDLFYWLSVA